GTGPEEPERGERSSAAREPGRSVQPDRAVLGEPGNLLRDEPAVPGGPPPPGAAPGRVLDDAQECGRRENLLMRCWRGAMKTLPRIVPLILTLTVLTTIPAASPAASKNDGRPDGGILAYGEYGRPATLDPITSNEMISMRITELVFYGLVGIDTTQELITVQAERWEVSQDGRSYTFCLRKRVR